MEKEDKGWVDSQKSANLSSSLLRTPSDSLEIPPCIFSKEGSPETIPFVNSHILMENKDAVFNATSALEIQSLEDFIRFDITRRGGICCQAGYTIGVQYEDKFLVGRSTGGGYCCSCFSLSPNIQLILKDGQIGLLEIESTARTSCLGSKQERRYSLRNCDGGGEVGIIRIPSLISDDNIQEIRNISENASFSTRKHRPDIYSICNELGVKVAVVEIGRGFRGGISSYGLTILDDAISPLSKAFFISSTIAMDLEDRASEVKCKLVWAPLICLILITILAVFHFIPSTSKLNIPGT